MFRKYTTSTSENQLFQETNTSISNVCKVIGVVTSKEKDDIQRVNTILKSILCFLSAPHLWRGVTRKWRTSESSAGVDEASALLQRCHVQSRSHYLCISSLLFREMKIREKSKHTSGNRSLLSFVFLVSGPDTYLKLKWMSEQYHHYYYGKKQIFVCVWVRVWRPKRSITRINY